MLYLCQRSLQIVLLPILTALGPVSRYIGLMQHSAGWRRYVTGIPSIFTSAKREVKDLRSLGMFQSCNFGTSECPEVATELVRDICELFDLFFQGKEVIMRKYYLWKK